MATHANHLLPANECTSPRELLAQRQLPAPAAFAEWLAGRLAQVSLAGVESLIEVYFPEPDLLECGYLATALRLLEEARYCEREVGCGTDWVFWGIEYSAQKVARTRQWIAAAQARLQVKPGQAYAPDHGNPSLCSEP